jgi:hypothetical protein
LIGEVDPLLMAEFSLIPWYGSDRRLPRPSPSSESVHVPNVGLIGSDALAR